MGWETDRLGLIFGASAMGTVELQGLYRGYKKPQAPKRPQRLNPEKKKVITIYKTSSSVEALGSNFGVLTISGLEISAPGS